MLISSSNKLCPVATKCTTWIIVANTFSFQLTEEENSCTRKDFASDTMVLSVKPIKLDLAATDGNVTPSLKWKWRASTCFPYDCHIYQHQRSYTPKNFWKMEVNGPLFTTNYSTSWRLVVFQPRYPSMQWVDLQQNQADVSTTLKFLLRTVLRSRPFIPVDKDKVPTPSKVKEWKYLNTIHPYLQQEDDDVEVDILIGGNCPRPLEPVEVNVNQRSQIP